MTESFLLHYVHSDFPFDGPRLKSRLFTKNGRGYVTLTPSVLR